MLKRPVGKNFGQFIHDLRMKRNQSQTCFAISLNSDKWKTKSTLATRVSQWERGFLDVPNLTAKEIREIMIMLNLKGEEQIEKTHPMIADIKGWVDREYENGRITVLTDDEIESYVSSSEPYDKAGAYGIQGQASLLVSGINGDYFNVVGFPVARVKRELLKFLKNTN